MFIYFASQITHDFLNHWRIFKIEIVSLQAAEFRAFSAASQIKGVCEGIQSSEGRKIGEALEAYYKNFQGIKSKKANFKMALFMVVKGATIGKVELLQKYGEMYKKLGVKIYLIGIGSALNMDQMKMITEMGMIYQAKTYASVMTGAGLTIGGAAGGKSMFLALQAACGGCKLPLDCLTFDYKVSYFHISFASIEPETWEQKMI